MHWMLLFVTFVSVNLDFFFMLLFLLRKYNFSSVLIGYLLGIVSLLSLSYIIGFTLKLFLPLWVLGVLGFIPIFMAFNDDDSDQDKISSSAILSTFLTYLSTCTGCNLSLFLPVLVNENWVQFGITLIYISCLTVIAVILIKLLEKNHFINQIMGKYGELLTKICYISIGIYVFFDSGLINHVIHFL